MLFDPQTSGGLLIAVDPNASADCIVTLSRHGVEARQVGHVVTKRLPPILWNDSVHLGLAYWRIEEFQGNKIPA